MAKSSNQKKKLFLILKLFEEQSDENNPLSIEKIISYLESHGIQAERKSIYSDIKILEELDFDIIFERKKGYYLASREFQLPELKLLCDAVAASKFITPKKSDELIEKLKKLTSTEQAKSLRRQVHVANRIKTMNESIYYSIDDIHKAIAEKRKISFKYFDLDENKKKKYRHNGKKYIVSPLSLIWDDENYYLIAYDSEAKTVKHYRADKAENITILNENTDPEAKKNLNISEYTSKLFGMFGGKEEAVWLSCENDFAGIIIDRFGKDLTFIKIDDNHFKVRVKVIVSPWFFSWIVGMNGKIKIIEPENVVKKFIETLNNIEQIHKI